MKNKTKIIIVVICIFVIIGIAGGFAAMKSRKRSAKGNYAASSKKNGGGNRTKYEYSEFESPNSIFNKYFGSSASSNRPTMTRRKGRFQSTAHADHKFTFFCPNNFATGQNHARNGLFTDDNSGAGEYNVRKNFDEWEPATLTEIIEDNQSKSTLNSRYIKHKPKPQQPHTSNKPYTENTPKPHTSNKPNIPNKPCTPKPHIPHTPDTPDIPNNSIPHTENTPHTPSPSPFSLPLLLPNNLTTSTILKLNTGLSDVRNQSIDNNFRELEEYVATLYEQIEIIGRLINIFDSKKPCERAVKRLNDLFAAHVINKNFVHLLDFRYYKIEEKFANLKVDSTEQQEQIGFLVFFLQSNFNYFENQEVNKDDEILRNLSIRNNLKTADANADIYLSEILNLQRKHGEELKVCVEKAKKLNIDGLSVDNIKIDFTPI
ncbi:hypothetical protein EDEG_00257 [Edhazardia aedis USNM 41457]|uniref:Uncharacterized protein n=1 Tax=Edhazardia aedis (strain USNM 41457) TaxID=1003232 RepID=J9DJK4_EDHAE|nr:hypothetical protein EDEG_00257 [Edhazardia aedis USNM 41457]|eukprot:EJW02800.1 hypothetical protein EDEG_00257 [Edhazardia aedis USNM 41457]